MELGNRIMVTFGEEGSVNPHSGKDTSRFSGAAQIVFLDQGDYYIGMYALKYSSSCTLVACTQKHTCTCHILIKVYEKQKNQTPCDPSVKKKQFGLPISG